MMGVQLQGQTGNSTTMSEDLDRTLFRGPESPPEPQTAARKAPSEGSLTLYTPFSQSETSRGGGVKIGRGRD